MSAVAAQLVLAGVILGSMYAVVGLALSLIYGASRVLNLAQGEFVMLGCFLGYWVSIIFGVPPLVALPFAAILGSSIGLSLYGFFRNKLQTQTITEIENYSLLVSFALILLLSNGVAWVWTPNFYVYEWMMVPISGWGISFMASKLYLLAISLLAVALTLIFLYRTKLGSSIMLTIENRKAAMLIGINTANVDKVVLVSSILLCLVEGIIVGFNFPFNAFVGIPYTVIAFVVIILGGIGSPIGSLVGGLTLGVVESTLVYILAPALKIAISYAILIGILLIRPQGIFGKGER